MLRGSFSRFVVVLAVAAALLGTAAAARAADPPQPGQHHGQTGVMRVKGGGAAAAPFAAPAKRTADYPGPLINHGGPVMTTHTIRAIYWYPSGYTVDPDWKQIVDGYLSNVAMASGATDNVYGVATQYGVHYDSTYGGSVVATDPFPTSGGCAFGGGNPCLNENQIEAEIKKVVADHSVDGWSADSGSPASHPTHLFMIYLPPGVVDCSDFGTGSATFCSGNASNNQYYCAYHGAFTSAGQTYVWGNMPYVWDLDGCQSDQFPNESGGYTLPDADTAIDVTSHEWIEALTDPYLNAWYDGSPSGYEIADKCQFTYGDPLGDVGGQYFNQSIHGGSYWTQLEYSNSLGDCAPVAPPTITSIPAPAHGGDVVHILGSALYGPVVVKFNGIVATVDNVTPTDLTVEVPASGNPNGKITVQALGGKATSTQVFGIVPSVTILSAMSGYAGSTVTVTGSGFFGVKSVKFGGVTGTFNTVAANGTTLKAVVPTAALSGFVTVTTAGGPSPDSVQFVVRPKITSFTPAAATAGTMVTINGSGLTAANNVVFHSAASPSVDFAHGTATKLVAMVPDDMNGSGPITVYVNASTDQATSAANFKPLPKITSLDAYDGKAGNTVTISGSNLIGGTVKFGTFTAQITSGPTDTEIQATVPAAPFASGNVMVTNANGTATSPKPFAITKVTSFSPLAAAAGATVTINGQGLGSTSTVDFLGHTGVVPTGTPTATSVKVVVPDDAVNDHLILHTPNIDGAGITTVGTFKAMPKITSFTPADGQATTPVTITGTNLSNVSAPTIKFGTVNQPTFSVVDAHTITTAVPAGFTSGAITVATAGGTAVSKTTFAVTKITSISPSMAVAGATVMVSGQGLGSATSVDFNGGPDQPISSAAANWVKVIVPSDATVGPLTVNTPNLITPVTSVAQFKPLPKIGSLSPTAVLVGGQLQINGSNFEATGIAPTSVKLGTLTLPLTADSETQLTVGSIPDAALTGTLTVTTPTGSTTAKLNVLPTIDTLSTDEAFAGDPVTLTGRAFTGTTSVKFANGGTGVTAPFHLTGATGTAQTLTFNVPATAVTGPITVTNAGGSSASDTVTIDPKITSFTPTNAAAGDTVTLTGSGFGLGGDTRVVQVGSVTATNVTYVSANSLKFVVPDGAPTADLIHVQVNGNLAIANSNSNLIVTATLTSFTPSHGPAGHQVIITGAGFTGATAVKFHGIDAQSFVVNNDGQITAHVPAGTTPGKITITRPSAPTTLTSATNFDNESAITSFAPTDAHAGDTITVHGTDLGTADLVTFAGTNATATPTSTPTATSFDVVVPATTETGTITVHTSLGDVVSADSFTIDPTIDSFTPSQAGSGQHVVITGSGFKGATSVKVTSSPAGWLFIVDSATQITATCPGNVGTGNFVVTTPAGDSAPSSEEFTYMPPPNVDSFNPPSAAVGDTVEIDGSHFTGATTVSFHGTVAPTFSVVDDSTITATVPSGATTGTVSVTTTYGTGTSFTPFTVTP